METINRIKFGIDLTHSLREWLLCHAGLDINQGQKIAEEFSAHNMNVDWIELTNEKGTHKTFRGND